MLELVDRHMSAIFLCQTYKSTVWNFLPRHFHNFFLMRSPFHFGRPWRTSRPTIIKCVYYILNMMEINRKLKSRVSKAIPLPAWTSPLGSRRMRLPEFLDSRHMKVPYEPADSTPYPRRYPWYSFLSKAVSTPRPYSCRKD
jgi:hypothetical protein